MSDLPPGFVMDIAPSPPQGALPPGFVMDETAAPKRLGVGESSTPMQSMTTGFLNQGSAASQGTTPDVTAQSKNLISAETYQNDAGEVLFRDPKTGQVVPTDKNKHVALRDPKDNLVKVFERTPATDEGRLSAAGRLLTTGMGTSATTARPAIPLATRSATPSVEALKDAATAGYTSPEIAAVLIKPGAVQSFADSVVAHLNQQGIDENLAPKTLGVLGRISGAPVGSFTTGQNLEIIRRTLGKAASLPDATERLAARTAMEALDEFYSNVPKADVLAGDPSAAAAAVREGRGNYAAASRAELLDRKRFQAELRAASTNSGQNIPNTMRQRIAGILLSPAERRGFSPDELEAMDSIVRGTGTQNTIRMASNMLGGGGGASTPILAALGGFFTAGSGGWGAAAPVVGVSLRKLQGALSDQAVDRLSELIRSRSPLAQQMAPPVRGWVRASAAYERQRTPRTIAMLGLASRNLSNNLRDAGISIDPKILAQTSQTGDQAGMAR